jgi:hypothetical protein
MDPDAWTVSGVSINGDVGADVKPGWGRVATTSEHAPEESGARVTKNGTRPARQYRRHPPPLPTQSAMAHGVNAAMNAVQTSVTYAPRPAPLAYAGAFQLRD